MSANINKNWVWLASTKTASSSLYQSNISPDRELDPSVSPQAELRYRRPRHSSEDSSAAAQQMGPHDERISPTANNQMHKYDTNHSDRRHSGTFGIDSYRPLKSVLTPHSASDQDGLFVGDRDSNERRNEAHNIASGLNQTSPKHSSKSAADQIQLTTIMAPSTDVDEAEFIGEFTPRREMKDDVELEPLLQDDMDEQSSAFDNKAFAGNGDDQAPKGSPTKRDKKLQPAVKSTQDENRPNDAQESAFIILLQVSFPFFIAGCGTVGAGLVLDKVQHHRVFTEVPQLFILVPALLGLKGNLEMTLASRLSTLANLGRMDTKKEKIKQVVGNLALIQAQAAVVGFMAAVFAIILGWIPKGEFRLDHALLLCASSLATASLASLILGAVMVAVVLLSKTLNINPDNVATPIAASLGDLTTLSLLAAAGGLLVNATDADFWLAPFIIAIFILLCPLWIWMSSKNPVTREVLISGWSPVIFSMLISSAGGFILEYTVATYKGIAVFQPVINGIGGNLVAVQASRISTSLHKESRLGVLPASAPSLCFNPWQTFFGKRTHSKAARVLMALVVPGHLIFMTMIHYLRAGHTPISPLFAVLYCSAAVVQVFILLYSCVIMVNSMWKQNIDPDNSAIPYLTALGDLLGTALLAIAFHILYATGERDVDIGK